MATGSTLTQEGGAVARRVPRAGQTYRESPESGLKVRAAVSGSLCGSLVFRHLRHEHSDEVEHSHIALALRLVEQSILMRAIILILFYPRCPSPGYLAWSHPAGLRFALATCTASPSSPVPRGELCCRRGDRRRSGPPGRSILAAHVARATGR